MINKTKAIITDLSLTLHFLYNVYIIYCFQQRVGFSDGKILLRLPMVLAVCKSVDTKLYTDKHYLAAKVLLRLRPHCSLVCNYFQVKGYTVVEKRSFHKKDSSLAVRYFG